MPELPEVETVCRGLHEKIANKTIAFVDVKRRGLRYELPPHFEIALENQTIQLVKRRAKIIQIFLKNNQVLLIHLGMSGRLTWMDTTPALEKHDHVVFSFADGTLTYNDPRRFGFMDVIQIKDLDAYPYLKRSGVEPLGQNLTVAYCLNTLAKRKQPIKQVLMDHSFIVGVGNIYAAECLWHACIDPRLPAQDLNADQWQLLIKNLKNVLRTAIDAGGSTLKDFRNTGGDIGYFQLNHKVYGKQGQPCPRCATRVERFEQGGRSTFFCPQCQNYRYSMELISANAEK